MQFKGIIFDLDGTLLDSMHCWENVDRQFLLENGVEPPEGVSDIVKKMTIEDSANYFKREFSLSLTCQEIIDRIEEMVREQYFSKIPLKAGAYDTVHSLKAQGYRLCVATATYNRLAYAALRRTGIFECFDFVLTCSDVGAGKDSPEIFLKAAEKMGCDTGNALVVEDSLHCIETAAAAGFRTAAVYDEIAAGEWERICSIAWRNVKSLSELKKLL